MSENTEDLAPFQEICRKICLNIPENLEWQWDEDRDMAVIILEADDAELVFFPLFKEFENHWNFSSSDNGGAPPIGDYINSKYGLMPGQAFFTSYSLCNLVLSVAWWPWGEENKISMRVGLIPVDPEHAAEGMAFGCLSQWLKFSK